MSPIWKGTGSWWIALSNYPNYFSHNFTHLYIFLQLTFSSLILPLSVMWPPDHLSSYFQFVTSPPSNDYLDCEAGSVVTGHMALTLTIHNILIIFGLWVYWSYSKGLVLDWNPSQIYLGSPKVRMQNLPFLGFLSARLIRLFFLRFLFYGYVSLCSLRCISTFHNIKTLATFVCIYLSTNKNYSTLV